MIYLIAMILSVLEGRFPIPFHVVLVVFYTFGIAFYVVVTGEDRNFKCDTDVYRNISYRMV